MSTYDIYDEDGKLLGSFGSDSPAYAYASAFSEFLGLGATSIAANIPEVWTWEGFGEPGMNEQRFCYRGAMNYTVVLRRHAHAANTLGEHRARARSAA